VTYHRLDRRTLPSRAWPPFITDAACADPDIHVDADDFFPVSAPPQLGAAQTARALAVCAMCPVRSVCLLFALDTGQRHGIWGGTTAGTRTKIRTNRQANL
jgi:WhiB family redox-sensing transcriptional regulator